MYDSEDVEPTPITPIFVQHITEVVQRLTRAQEQVSKLEEAYKLAKAVLDQIQCIELPDLLQEMGLEEFTTSSGLKVRLKSDVKVNITKENLPAAVRWMDEHGFGDLVKRAFHIQFGRDEAELAKKFASQLAEQAGLDVEEGLKIEPSTLKKFVRGQIADGGDLPTDLINVFEFRLAEVK